MKLLLILGNQLFPLKNLDQYKQDHIVFMSEDHELCSYEKHHKLKILLFLSCMRSYAESLKVNKFKIEYSRIDSTDFRKNYIEKLKRIISSENIKEITCFEIEDKLFEAKIKTFINKSKIKLNYIKSPMFLNSREDFKNYLSKTKKPFMATFYKEKRQKFNILMKKNGTPEGGKWSFDEDNRNKLPKNISIPKFPKVNQTKHTKILAPIIEKLFKKHPGSTKDFWFATEYNEVIKLLNFFIKEKSNLFGDYEDAVNQQNNILFHSALSPYLNLGLITPDLIIKKIIDFHKKNKIRINSLEGYVRQVIGWREFMRGIYQNYSSEMESKNFFKHNRRMKDSWYDGTTGLPPLDYAIRNVLKHGWSHHIERLMVLGNIMLLLEINPNDINRWFMELFIDSYEWVMIPNIYGMSQFSDGGLMSTKPYISSSNYILKMSNYKKADWCKIWDSLFWQFISKHQEKLKINQRMSFMTSLYSKKSESDKEKIKKISEDFKEKIL